LRAPGSGGSARKNSEYVPKRTTPKWFRALAFGALAAASLAAGGSPLPILLLASAIGGGFFLAERQGWLRASEKNSRRDGAVTAAFSLLVLLFADATGGAASPLLYALYLPILLATLCYGMRLGLWTSLGMAAAYAKLWGHSLPPAARLGPELAVTLSYPVMAIFGGVLRAQMESRLSALNSEKQDITAMLDMSQMMESAIDLDMALNLILLNVQQHCDCRVCAVYLKSADGRSLELRAASGQRGKVSLLPAFPVDEARREIRAAPGAPQADHILASIDSEAASFASLPLAGVEGLLGMLYVGCPKPNGLTAETVQRLEQIAVYAAFPLQRVLVQQDFRALAYSDPMTGLDNFRQFEETLADEMARAERYDRPLSVILLDIDHFKSFNDTLGHPAGDALLGQLGVVLRNCLRNVDRPARYGGEEFVVICPETGAREVKLIAERIRRSVAETAFALLEKTREIQQAARKRHTSRSASAAPPIPATPARRATWSKKPIWPSMMLKPPDAILPVLTGKIKHA